MIPAPQTKQPMRDHRWPNLANLNLNSVRLANAAADNPRLQVKRCNTATAGNVLDFATGQTGTIAAGIQLAKICLADLAEVDMLPPTDKALPLPAIHVTTDAPVEACMASQYAGWPISVDKYFAMGSGPARSLRGKEEVLGDYALTHSHGPAVAVLETSVLPDDAIINNVAAECGVAAENVTLCVARTASLPGCIQVVARSIEVALHKLHELKFDLAKITNATGVAPLPPVAKDDLTALGWTNDAILYGGQVNLWVDTDDEMITSIGPQIPSNSSDDFGEPFLTLFKRYDMDFYKMDKLLFSPAVVTINNVRTGNTFSYGSVRTDILKQSFAIQST